MPLTPAQLARVKSQNPTLKIDGTCTLIDSYLEENITLEKNVTIQNSHIGRNVSVGENSAIRNCRIANHSQIPASVVIHDQLATQNVTADPDLHLPLPEFLLEKLPQSLIFQKWSAADGDGTLRLDYPFRKHDRVFDVGGYLGDFAHEILARHEGAGIDIDVFEPVSAFADHIQNRFPQNPNVRVHRFGLAGASRTEPIALASESSSIIRDLKGPMQNIQLRSAKEFFAADFREIALLKINIEGCEYELLDHLLEENLFGQVRWLQVQFHDFVEDSRARRREIRHRLAKSHRQQWNFPFIWESWQRKGDGHAVAS